MFIFQDCLLKYKNRIPILKDEQLNSLQIHPDHKFINYELISLEGKTKFFIGKIADLSVIGLDIQAITAEMLAVLNPDIWLDADTIAILIGLYIERSGQRNVRLVSSYNIKYLLEPGKIQSVSRNSGLAFILSNTNGIWICPLHTMGSTTPCRTIIDGNHWVLMILDFQAKKFFYLDPLKARSSCAAEVKTTVLSNLKFICSANGKTFDDKNWLDHTWALHHQLQVDGFNCGLFVTKYAQAFLRNKKLNRFESTHVERVKSKKLIMESIISFHICIYCGTEENLSLPCNICKRISCNNCLAKATILKKYSKCDICYLNIN